MVFHNYRNGRLVHYSMDILVKGGFLNFRSSATSPRVLVTVSVFVVLGILYALGICNPDQLSIYGQDFCVYKVPVQEGLLFGSLLSFLLGMLTTSSYNRWWAQRNLLQQLFGRTAELAFLGGAHVFISLNC